MPLVTELASQIGIARACATLKVPRSSYYRFLKPKTTAPNRQPRRLHPRALTAEEQDVVRTELNSERFVDATPRTMYDTLLAEGRVLCHWRTMYRLLQADNATRERRAVRRSPTYVRPELLATQPCQVWSWDITLLRGPRPGVWYRLYVVVDIFSRKVVGWLVAEHEQAALAEQLLADACHREEIGPQQLTVHADRGAAMTAKTVAEMLLDLGVEQSHSRPSVSNDNPYSESQFKTMKYGARYPDRFASLDEAEQWVEGFMQWYNTEHRHSGIGFLTPEMHHRGQGNAITTARQQVLDTAYAAHPERFVRGQPSAPEIPTHVWINAPTPAVSFAATPASPPNPDGGQGSQPPQRSLDAQSGSVILQEIAQEETATIGRDWS